MNIQLTQEEFDAIPRDTEEWKEVIKLILEWRIEQSIRKSRSKLT